MKTQTTYRLTRNDLRKLGGQVKPQSRTNLRRFLIVIGATSAIGGLATLARMAEPVAVAPQPVAPVTVAAPIPAPAPEPTYEQRQLAEVEREAQAALDRYNNPGRYSSAVLNVSW
jgi:hypothetical protein